MKKHQRLGTFLALLFLFFLVMTTMPEDRLASWHVALMVVLFSFGLALVVMDTD